MTQVVRSFRGVSAEDRRAERRAQLVSAALDVLGESGLSKFTMTAVCRRAGLTERYFYESFANRDELLVAALDEIVAEVFDVVAAALASAPEDMFEKVRSVVGSIVLILTDDPRKSRIYLEAAGNPELGRRRDQAVQRLAGVLATVLTDAYDLHDQRHPVRTDVAALVLVAGVTELVDRWLGGSLPMSREELIDECAHMTVATGERLAARNHGADGRSCGGALLS